MNIINLLTEIGKFNLFKKFILCIYIFKNKINKKKKITLMMLDDCMI